MAYDPRMLQLTRMGINMMGPQAGPFDRANQPKRWWEQPLPQAQQRNDDNPSGQMANQPANPSKQQPSLLQMLMLGANPTYSGTPAAPGSPQAKAWSDMQSLFKSAGPAAGALGPWGLLGSMGLPGGAGWGGSSTPG